MLRAETVIPHRLRLIWMYTGLYMVVFLANMQKLTQPDRGRQIDRASETQIFFRLIVPLLSAQSWYPAWPSPGRCETST
jgi:raffinose/stachyose/melibiose transport system permease protein